MAVIYCGACKNWHISNEQIRQCHGLPTAWPNAGTGLDGRTAWPTSAQASAAASTLSAHLDAEADAA